LARGNPFSEKTDLLDITDVGGEDYK